MATEYGESHRTGASENPVPSRDRELDNIRREVNRISALLDAMRFPSASQPPCPQPSIREPKPSPLVPISFDRGRAKLVQQLYLERRCRDQYFPSDMFHDPAWDMLLDLYGAHYRRRQISISSLCIASCVPATTALRWIGTMEAAGLFVRSHDPHDGRRIFIALSERARLSMDEYFDKLAELRGNSLLS